MLAAMQLERVTQITGTVAYALATIACSCAVWRLRGPERRWWGGMLAGSAALTIDVLLNLRFILANALSGISKRGNWYADRAPVQIVFHVVCALGCLALGTVLLARARRFGWPLRLALVGAMMSMFVLLAEVVSLDLIDTILHTGVSGVMVVGVVWAVAGLMMAGGAVGRINRK